MKSKNHHAIKRNKEGINFTYLATCHSLDTPASYKRIYEI